MTIQGLSHHDGFNVHRHSPVIEKEMSKRIVRCANKRIEKSGIIDFCGSSTKIGFLQHSQIDLGDCLGLGSFSSVYEIKSIDSTEKYDSKKLVVKVLRAKLSAKPPMLAACAADLVKEGMIMATLDHHNVLHAQAWAPTGVPAYINGRHDAFFLVLDRLEETLSDRFSRWIKQSKKINYSWTHRSCKKTSLLKERLDVMIQISAAVKYLHSKNLLHRDLKPDNIGFDRDDVLKVFDFDVARIVPESVVPDECFSLTKRVGSPRYMSPECFRGETYNLKADVYAFGLLAHELISLEKPYNDLPSGRHNELVFFEGVRPCVPTSWPKEIRSLLQRCWSDDVSVRPTMDAAHTILEKELPLMIAPKQASKNAKPWSLKSTKTLSVSVCA
jgi:serine/threonine protein kinase